MVHLFFLRMVLLLWQTSEWMHAIVRLLLAWSWWRKLFSLLFRLQLTGRGWTTVRSAYSSDIFTLNRLIFNTDNRQMSSLVLILCNLQDFPLDLLLVFLFLLYVFLIKHGFGAELYLESIKSNHLKKNALHQWSIK